MPEAFILDGVRTPIGRYGGSLSAVRPDDLAQAVLFETQEKVDRMSSFLDRRSKSEKETR